MSAQPRTLLAELRELGFTLCETYPYASQLGRYLAADERDWVREFETSDPEAASLPLAQAREFAFLEFCESWSEWRERLDARVAGYLADGPRHLRDELANTVSWYRKLSTRQDW